LPMKLRLLDSSLEPAFWDYVLRDVPGHYFFILDWKLYRDKTQIFLALQDEKTVGLMLIYDQRIVQIRGSSQAAERLINEVNLEKAEINAFKEHEAIILKKYKPIVRHEMILMTLHRGEERLYIKHPITKLTPVDAQEIVNLLKEEFAEWREFTPDRVNEQMEENVLFLGIKEGEKLVSIGNTRVFGLGSNIGMIATRKGYRDRGFATSITSALLKEILRESKLALIHVLSDNPPAIHVYTKVGFKPYKTYLLVRGERI